MQKLSSSSAEVCNASCMPQAKRTKLEDMTSIADTVFRLNELGVHSLEMGKAADAANTFFGALYQCLAETSPGQQCTMDAGLLLQDHQSASASSIGQQRERAEPSCYIFQREEYDEGLCVFDKALTFEQDAPRLNKLVVLRYNIAQVQIHFRNFNQAREWFLSALTMLQQESQTLSAGHNTLYHQHQLYLLHNLGYCCYCLGQTDQALQYYQDARSLLISKLNEAQYHLERAATFNCIAVLLYHKSNGNDDKCQKALGLLQKSLQLYHSEVGYRSIEVATCLGNLGRIHFLRSEHGLAKVAFQKSYSSRKKLLGADSIDTAAMLFNLGQAYHFSGDFDRALEAYKEFIRVTEAHFGPNHRDRCAAMKAMAHIHRHRGDISGACSLLLKAFEVGSAALGPQQKEVSCILSDLGGLYAESHDYDKAMDCFQKFLKIQEQVVDQNHPNILVTKVNIARVYKQSCNYSCSLKYYREALAIQNRLYGSTSLEVASTLSSMGLMFYLMEAYTQSLSCYQEALRIRLEVFGVVEHEDIAETVNSIGLVLFKLGEMRMARQTFHECIRLRTKLTGPETREVAVLWFNIATVYLQSGEDADAIAMYKESLRIEKNVLGADHLDCAMTLQHLANVYEENGQLELAIETFTEALRIVERGGNVESRFRLYNLIGNLNFMQGLVDQMVQNFVAACRLSNGPGVDALSISGENFYSLSKLHPLCAAVA